MDMTYEEYQIADKSFEAWWDDEKTQRGFHCSHASDSEIASSSFYRGFELAKELFAKKDDENVV